MSSVSGTQNILNAQTFIPAILSMRQYSASGTCLTSVNMQEYMSPPSDLCERVTFSLTYTEIP